MRVIRVIPACTLVVLRDGLGFLLWRRVLEQAVVLKCEGLQGERRPLNKHSRGVGECDVR